MIKCLLDYHVVLLYVCTNLSVNETFQSSAPESSWNAETRSWVRTTIWSENISSTEWGTKKSMVEDRLNILDMLTECFLIARVKRSTKDLINIVQVGLNIIQEWLVRIKLLITVNEQFCWWWSLFKLKPDVEPIVKHFWLIPVPITSIAASLWISATGIDASQYRLPLTALKQRTLVPPASTAIKSESIFNKHKNSWHLCLIDPNCMSLKH